MLSTRPAISDLGPRVQVCGMGQTNQEDKDKTGSSIRTAPGSTTWVKRSVDKNGSLVKPDTRKSGSSVQYRVICARVVLPRKGGARSVRVRMGLRMCVTSVSKRKIAFCRVCKRADECGREDRMRRGECRNMLL